MTSTPTVTAQVTPLGDPPQPLPPTPLAPPTPGGNPFVSNTPSVPEPQTWVQLVLGFGVIGGVARVTYRRNGTDPKAAPADS